MSDLRAMFGEGFFDHTVITVRNPYDRIASEFRLRAALSKSGFWKSLPTFSHWLETTLTQAARDPFHLDNHIRPQWQFHGSEVEVLKYEDGLCKIIGRIAEILGVEPPDEVLHVHETNQKESRVSWDLIDRLRVQEFYRKDFETFSYEF